MASLSSNHSGVKTITFDGNNFVRWKFKMAALLMSQVLLHYVEPLLPGDDGSHERTVKKEKAYIGYFFG